MHLHSFRFKLLVSVILVVTTLLSAIMSVSYLDMYSLIRDELTANMQRTTQAVASEINTWAQSRLADAAATAALPAAKNINNDFSQIDQVNIGRYQLFKRQFPGEYGDIFAANNKYEYHSIIETNGKPAIFSGTLRGRKYYDAIMAGAPAHISPPLFSRTSGVPSMFVIAPIHDERGIPQGLVGVGMTMQFLQQKVDDLRYGKTGFGFLLGRDGTFIAHPDRSLVMSYHYNDIGDPGARKLGDAMITGSSGMEQYTYNGKESLAFYHPIPASGWSMAFIIEKNELYAPALKVLHKFIAMSSASILLVVISMLLVSRRLTRPIDQLKHFAVSVASGDFSKRPDITGDDEFKELAAAFEGMRTQLDSLFEELDSTKDYLDSVFNAMPASLVGITDTGVITTMNSTAEEVAGVSRDEARGKPLSDIFPAYLSMTNELINAMRRKEQFYRDRIRHQLKDGALRYETIQAFPLRSSIGGAVVRIEDISDRVRVEEVMVQSEKMLSVGGLAAGMAHEINNPLGGILQGAQNIFRRLDAGMQTNHEAAQECGTTLEAVNCYLEDRKIIRMITGIRDSARRAADITGSMLSFVRKDHNAIEQHDVNALIDETILLASSDYNLKKKYDFKNVRIVKHYDEKLQTIPCARTEIEQVLLNLIQNATYAMSTKSYPIGAHPELILTTSQNQNHLVITVDDNGPGISEKIRKRIFEPFFTTKGTGEGTGLGLAVSYFIITQNHYGDITVDSTPGSGTRFTIQLPFDRPGRSL